MMSMAAIKAFWQIIAAPSFWEKTTHGLSSSTAAADGPHANGNGAGTNGSTGTNGSNGSNGSERQRQQRIERPRLAGGSGVGRAR